MAVRRTRECFKSFPSWNISSAKIALVKNNHPRFMYAEQSKVELNKELECPGKEGVTVGQRVREGFPALATWKEWESMFHIKRLL